MHVNMGLLPPFVPQIPGRRKRYAAFSTRAEQAMSAWLESHPDLEIEHVRAGLAKAVAE
jgi:folate-dependent tRNA-U54 methylase TrmFO/GidA